MRSISHSEFTEKMKYASMICAPEYGYYVNVEKRNPYFKKPFVVTEEFETFCAEYDSGTTLKMTKGDEVILYAFIF